MLPRNLSLLLLATLSACGRDSSGPSIKPLAARLDLGARHGCLTTTASLVCWGQGTEGQLGIGPISGDTTPVTLPSSVSLVSIAAGATHTCGLDASGAAWCWGSDTYGELGSDAVDTSCGGIACVGTPVRAATGLTFTSLAAGVSFTCGLTANGTVYCWGLNDTGQLGTSNDVTCGGIRCSPAPALAAGGAKFGAIAAGQQHVCALRTNGQAACWGYDGLLEDGRHINAQFLPEVRARTGPPPLVRISAGGYHTCAATEQGDAWCWGIDALGAGASVLESVRPIRVTGGHHFTSIAAARFTVCGLDSNGTAWCWGPNVFGEIGTQPVGSTSRFDTPTAVSGGFQFRSLFPGWNTYCGITTGGGVACWGRGVDGELGIGNSDTSTPIIVQALSAQSNN